MVPNYPLTVYFYQTPYYRINKWHVTVIKVNGVPAENDSYLLVNTEILFYSSLLSLLLKEI